MKALKATVMTIVAVAGAVSVMLLGEWLMAQWDTVTAWVVIGALFAAVTAGLWHIFYTTME